MFLILNVFISHLKYKSEVIFLFVLRYNWIRMLGLTIANSNYHLSDIVLFQINLAIFWI